MAISKYQNFKEYSENDSNYFSRALLSNPHKPQSKITFQDGSTYHVTKSGSRYWQLGDYTHREDGPACVWSENHPGSFYLFSVGFRSREDHELAVNRLEFLREQTKNKLEDIVENIAKNVSWEDRQKLWKTILCGSTDSTAMLESLNKLSKRYETLSKMTQDFSEKFA